MSVAAADHSRKRSRTSATSSVVRSKAAKCRWACCGVVMPAWLRPKRGLGGAAGLLPTSTRPVSTSAAPPPPRASPAPVAPASWKSSRRLMPLRSSKPPCFLGMRSRFQGVPALGERLGEGVYALADLAPLVFVQVRVGYPSVALAVGLERLIDC